MSSTAAPEFAAPAPSGIVVGVAGWNSAETIAGLVRDVARGLDACGRDGCVLLADGGSTDRTVEVAQAALAGSCFTALTTEYVRPATDPLRAPYHGLPGRPAAIRAVMRTASERRAPALAFVDANLTSLTPEWIPRLVGPVIEDGFDYVSPRFARQPHEGGLTRSIVYPVFRALYGHRLHQPAAGEFGCSLRFIEYVLDQDLWDGEEAQTAIDLWLASAAVNGGMRVAEATFGSRLHTHDIEKPDLSTTLRQVVGALFADLTARTSVWQRVHQSVPVPSFGDPVPPASAPAVDVDRMLEAYRLGYSALRDLWAWLVEPRVMMQLRRLADAPPDRFRLPDELWVQIVYDFALAYGLRSMSREHLLGALTPLYLGWFAAFMLEHGQASPEEIEARLERLCLAFETRKPYLIAGWRWPERFRA